MRRAGGRKAFLGQRSLLSVPGMLGPLASSRSLGALSLLRQLRATAALALVPRFVCLAEALVVATEARVVAAWLRVVDVELLEHPML